MSASLIAAAWMIWATLVLWDVGQVMKSWITSALRVYADRTAAIREGFFQ